MRTIPARQVLPGMTIKTQPHGDTEPVTLTVADGGWCGEDYAELPVGAEPTHVYLGEQMPSELEVLLPVDAEVLVIREAPGAFETSAERVREGDTILDPRDGTRWVVHQALTTGKKARTHSLYPLTGSRPQPLHLTPGERITVVIPK